MAEKRLTASGEFWGIPVKQTYTILICDNCGEEIPQEDEVWDAEHEHVFCSRECLAESGCTPEEEEA